jgi:fatty acid amide hydrolase 2
MATAAERSGLTITERSALELARAIRSRQLTATEVLEAHLERLGLFGPSVHALAADRFERARAEAAVADARLAAAAGDGFLPPLLGVPFTVKESIAVEGMPNTAGVLARRHIRADRTAPTVQRLIDAGAIVVGVTNTSELTLWIESDNRLYGRTNNPYDAARTAGGSSGGEGAAVGCGGVPFGIGSDIAGSIRIPALFCGVFAHKPTAGLVPNTAMWPPAPGEAGRLLGVGPLARRAEDLMPILKLIAGPDGEDRLATAPPPDDPAVVSLSGLKIAVVEDSSTRPMDRELLVARERAVAALAAAGARPRRVSLRSWRRAAPAYIATLQARSDTGSARATIDLLHASGEALPTWGSLLRAGGVHTLPTRLILASELLPGLGDNRARRRLVAEGEALVEELLDAIGDGVLVHPAHPRPAPRHGSTIGRPWLLTGAALFNLAGLPATEVPLGLSSAGLPLGVQVVAGAGRDHVSIAVALELERVFGGWRPPKPPSGAGDRSR